MRYYHDRQQQIWKYTSNFFYFLSWLLMGIPIYGVMYIKYDGLLVGIITIVLGSLFCWITYQFAVHYLEKADARGFVENRRKRKEEYERKEVEEKRREEMKREMRKEIEEEIRNQSK